MIPFGIAVKKEDNRIKEAGYGDKSYLGTDLYYIVTEPTINYFTIPEEHKLNDYVWNGEAIVYQPE